MNFRKISFTRNATARTVVISVPYHMIVQISKIIITIVRLWSVCTVTM